MTVMTASFYSDELTRKVTFSAIIPKDNKPLKTLYLLHGFNGNHEDWINNTTITELSNRYNLAIIMPAGENSFYVDHPNQDNYGKLIGEELVEVTRYLFPLSHKREDTFIAGLSMGGYGALRNGFNYENTFSKIVALSSRILQKNDPYHDLSETNPINARIQHLLSSQTFKDLKEDMDIYHLIKQSRKQPDLFLMCGTEDHLYKENKSLHQWLNKKGYKHEYIEKTGGHTWPFWAEGITKAIPWLLNQ